MRRRLKHALWILPLTLVLAVAILCGLLMIPSVQQWAIAGVLARTLHADIRIEGVDLRNPAQFDFIELREKDAMDAPAAIKARDVELQYHLRPADGRYLERLASDGVILTFDGQNPQQTNYNFLKFSGATGHIDPPAYLPKFLALEHVQLNIKMPAWESSLDGIGVHGVINAADEGSLQISGNPAKASWLVRRYSPTKQEMEGTVDISVGWHGAAWQAQGQVTMPGMAFADGAIHAENNGEQLQLNTDITKLDLEGPLWGEMLESHAPFPVHFKVLHVLDTHINGTWTAQTAAVSQAKLEGSAEGLVVGNAESPFYMGNVSLVGSAGGETDNAKLDVELRLGQQQAVHVTLRGGTQKASLQADIKEWTREQLEGGLSPQYRAWLARAPKLEGISGAGSFTWSRPEYTITASIKPKLAVPGEDTMEIDGAGGGSQPLFQGSVKANHGKSSIESKLTLENDAAITSQIILKDVQPDAWLQAWTNIDVLKDLRGVWNGEISYVSGTDRKINVAVDGAAIKYGQFALTEKQKAHLSASVTADSGDHVQIEQLQASIGDDVKLKIAGANLDVSPFAIRDMTVEGAFGVAPFLALFGTGGASGQVKFNGPAALGKDGLLEATFQIDGDGLQKGDWALPNGVPLQGNGKIRYDFRKRKLSATPLALTLGPGTRLELAEVDADLAGPVALRAAKVKMVSDLTPLILRGVLESATGSATVSSDSLTLTGGSLHGALNFDIRMDAATLPKKIASLTALAFQGQINYADGFQGTGLIQAATLTTGGVPLAGLKGDVRAEGKTLHIQNLQTQLFGGSIKANIDFGVLEDLYPTKITATVENIDLDRFTKEFKPPMVTLTGIASGTIEITLDTQQLRDLKVALKSAGGITVNRDLVEQVLLSQYVQDATGSKRMSSMVQKVIGKAAQRPFDTGVITLGMQDGRVTGAAIVESNDLNLNIDIKADPDALLDALKIRQEHAGASR